MSDTSVASLTKCIGNLTMSVFCNEGVMRVFLKEKKHVLMVESRCKEVVLTKIKTAKC